MSELTSGVKFSVIIPAYNAAATICRALDSVLEQTFPAAEIIVVDDASTDNTRDLLKEKYTGRIVLIEKLFNAGSSVARNAAWDVATGDYIAFLDADDAWHRDKLYVLNTILTASPGIALFYHPYTQKPILQKALPANMTLFRLPFVKLLPSNPVATSCLVVKNKPEFRFEPAMRYTEDYDFCLRYGYKNSIYFITIPLTQIYRKFTSAGGVSGNTWKMRKGEIRAYCRLVKVNPMFLLLLPFLISGSLGKHAYKKFVKSDSGYHET
jgi:glycosyltransferase involved in cell wall biosynthesis